MSKKNGTWGIPQNAKDFLNPHYDDAFKKRHPILYVLTIVAIILLTCVGPIVFLGTVALIKGSFEFDVSIWEFLCIAIGVFCSFGISLGLCNLLMIFHKQYLGHYVTIICFVLGIIGSGLPTLIIWFLQ